MKKIITLLFVVCVFSINANAQILNRCKADFMTQYARINNGGGIGGSIEGKYFFNNNLAAGLKYEYIATLSASEQTASIGGRDSYLATGEYLFGAKKSRPFVGAMMGLHTVAVIKVGGANLLDGAESKAFGFGLRAGFQLKKTRLAFEYNIIPNNVAKGINDQSFWALKIGYTLGATEID